MEARGPHASNTPKLPPRGPFSSLAPGPMRRGSPPCVLREHTHSHKAYSCVVGVDEYLGNSLGPAAKALFTIVLEGEFS
jgi:hypothetical protein